MMGRVSGSFLSLISLAQVLGLLLSGYLAQKLGMRQLFLLCGGVLVLIVAAGFLRFRERPGVVPVAT